jgi:heptaprenyl diphosphate synthase
MAFSIAGAVLSLAGMILMKKIGVFSCISVSVGGGILHNVGQIAIACLWTQTAGVALYLPPLLISGTLAGMIIGVVAGLLVKKLEKLKMM